MTSSFRLLLVASTLTSSLALGCARGNQTADSSGVGGGGGSGDATASASSVATSTSTSSTTTGAGGGGGSAGSGGAVCGDGMVDAGEECDGSAPAGKACVDCKLVEVTSPVINEIVYDPSGADVGCYIEIFGPAGLGLSGYTLDAVNGSDGTVTAVATLSGHVIGASGYGSFAMGQFFKGEKFPAPTTSASLCRFPSGKDTGDNSVDFVVCAPTPDPSNKITP